MSHLTDEQIEGALQGWVQEPSHLAQCPFCEARLRVSGAIRDRLRRAFASIRAGKELTNRIGHMARDLLILVSLRRRV